MSGELVETAAPPIEGARTDASSGLRRLAALVPGALAATLVASVGLSHGGYFPTAWGPLTLAFLATSAVALFLSPRPALGVRELTLPGLLAAIVLWALASAAWGTPTEAVPEAQRTLVYASGALAFALVLHPSRVPSFLAGICGGIGVVCTVALAGRLFPERWAEYDDIGRYRLSEPVGYWNALGVLAAFGVLLALCLAAHSTSLVVRLVAAAATVPVALTLYFTFSRGAWLALFIGLVVVVLFDPHRLRLAVTVVVVGAWGAAAVGLAWRSGPLTEVGHPLSAASRDGHALAAIAVGLALCASAAAAVATALGPRVRLPIVLTRAANAALATGVAAGVVAVVVGLGGPSEIARSFAATNRVTGADLNERLFDLSGSGRVDGWRVAVDVAEEHPVIGSGGGSYERHWLRERPYEANIRDAHSLYLETIAEYGAVGMALVGTVLVVPLVLAVWLRRRPLVPAAAGLVALYSLHAAIDWDWEFPVLTLVALAGASAIVASAPDRERTSRYPVLAALVAVVVAVLAAPAVFGTLGARAEAASADAFADRDYDRAESRARSAERLVPWSVEPLLLLGRAQAAAGERASARQTFRRAVERAPERWRLWYELAAVSRGAERRAALREARVLNPREQLLDELSGP